MRTQEQAAPAARRDSSATLKCVEGKTGKMTLQKVRRPTRYSSRFENAEGRIEEIGIGASLKKQIALAKGHHEKDGLKTWVWNIRTGVTLHRIERAEIAVGGGR